MFWYEGFSFKAIVMANILSEHINPHLPYIVTKNANNSIFLLILRAPSNPLLICNKISVQTQQAESAFAEVLQKGSACFCKV